LLSHLRNYVLNGALPEVVLKPELAGELVKAYRQTIVYRDIIEAPYKGCIILRDIP